MIIECDRCEARVDAEVVGEYELEHTQEGKPVSWLFLRCPGCGVPMVAYQWKGAPKPERFHPPLWRANSRYPEAVRKSLEEARKCLRTGAYAATLLMCRRTIEAMCRSFSHKFRSLAGSLLDLHVADVLDERLFQWADELRVLSNQASHDFASRLTQQDASDLIGFTEAILDYAFTSKQRFADFKRRHGRSQAPRLPGRKRTHLRVVPPRATDTSEAEG